MARWHIPVGLTAAAVTLSIVDAAPLLELHRTRVVEDGEWFRVLTCHAVHFGGNHLLCDAMVFGILGVVTALRNHRRYVACLVLSAIGSAMSVLLLLPEIETYRGLSAIGSALFVLLATAWFRSAIVAGAWRRGIFIGVACTAFLGKTVLEIVTGETLFVDSIAADFVAVPLAHLVGGLTGLIVGLWPSVDCGLPLPARRCGPPLS